MFENKLLIIGYALIQLIITSKIICKPILVVISLDGFRSDYVSKCVTPTLYKLAQNGVTGHMISSFTTETFPNHQTIATGYYEEVHGIINNQMFDPEFNETFDMNNSSDKWWTEGPQIPVWIVNQMVNTGEQRISGVIQWPGGYVMYRKQRVKYLQLYDKDIPFITRLDIAIEWMTNIRAKANCVFVYFNQPDYTSHKFGPFSAQVVNHLKEIDSTINYFLMRFKKVSLLNTTNIIILSDHGMAQVGTGNIINIDEFPNKEWFKHFGGSSILSICPKPGYEDRVYQTLLKESLNKRFTVYKRKDIPNRFHYKKHRRVLPILIVADEGCQFIQQKYLDNPFRGNHGYDNLLASMRPLFIGSGPAFKKRYIHNNVFTNVDVFPLMLSILGIQLKHYPSNGSFNRVSDLLIS